MQHGGDSTLHQASTQFLQQVEDMRRKYMAEVERLCDMVLMMKRGRIVDRGSPADLLARYGRDDLEQVFLDIARDRKQGVEI